MILDANDIIIDNDEMELSDFNITSIAYDDNTNKLLITGNFDSVNSAKDVNRYYLYSLTGNTAKAIGPTIEDTV